MSAYGDNTRNWNVYESEHDRIERQLVRHDAWIDGLSSTDQIQPHELPRAASWSGWMLSEWDAAKKDHRVRQAK